MLTIKIDDPRFLRAVSYMKSLRPEFSGSDEEFISYYLSIHLENHAKELESKENSLAGFSEEQLKNALADKAPLIGSNIQPSTIELPNKETISLGDLVRSAVEKEEFRPREWNALTQEEREEKLAVRRKELEDAVRPKEELPEIIEAPVNVPADESKPSEPAPTV